VCIVPFAEFGIVAPIARNGVEELLVIVADPRGKQVPEVARAFIAALGAQLRMLRTRHRGSAAVRERICGVTHMWSAWNVSRRKYA
jgi:hypothetical protein